jgi:hypothetical protein
MFNLFNKSTPKNDTKSNFEPGDIVTLKSLYTHPHKMVISRNYYDFDNGTPGWFSVVVYFDEKKNIYHEKLFRQVVLEKI